MTDPNQLNLVVRDTLSPYLSGDYTLSVPGQERVIAANAALGTEYAKEQNLPVADWCYREINKKLNVLPPTESGTLLDVCAGTGYISLNLMRKKRFKKCVALDINPEALKILKDRATALGIEGIETRAGNIFQTEFPSESFDCIMGNSFLHHLPDVQSFLNEMYRILRPGGVLCLTHEPSPSSVWWENWISILVKKMLGKKHWRADFLPLTDIWQFERSALIKLYEQVGFDRTEVIGFGRLSSSIATVLNRLCVRLTGSANPSWVGYIGYVLRFFDFGPSRRLHADKWAAVSISGFKELRK